MSELVNAAPLPGAEPSVRERLEAWWRDWRRLSRDNKSLLVIALLAAFVAATIVVILWTASQNYVPLYGKQEMYDTANILELLEKEQVPFRLDKGTGQVLVPESQLAQVRMALAARGVRAAMPAGLESLSGTSSLGTSEFMESAHYRHALEGELARSIIALDAVRGARVHLAIPKRTLFVGRDEEKPTASVVLDLLPGRGLEAGQVEAIANLVAGSISGMKPEAVSIIDQAGQLLSSELGDKGGFGKLSVQQMEYVRKQEEYIKQRASDMLYPLLGAGNFRVQVAAEMDFNTIEETREKIDPDGVMRSESGKADKTIDSLALGIPGSLSNQPPVKKNAADNGKQGSRASESQSNDSRTERNEFSRQYDNSRTLVHTQYQQGRLQQLSVSVLINQQLAPKGGWSQEQLAQMQQMVQHAVGFNAERGDRFSFSSFDFNPLVLAGAAPSESAWWEQPIWQDSLRYLVGGLLGLALVFMGIRPLVKHLVRMQQPEAAEQETLSGEAELALEGPALNRAAGDARGQMRMSDFEVSNMMGQLGLGQEEGRLVGDEGLDLECLPEPGSDLELQLKHLQLLADKETVRVAEVIRQWVGGYEQR
ncbi:MAG: flagellar basal-body MS-ring/collar protein FliF [Aeromonadaceae bacterium]